MYRRRLEPHPSHDNSNAVRKRHPHLGLAEKNLHFAVLPEESERMLEHYSVLYGRRKVRKWWVNRLKVMNWLILKMFNRGRYRRQRAHLLAGGYAICPILPSQSADQRHSQGFSFQTKVETQNTARWQSALRHEQNRTGQLSHRLNDTLQFLAYIICLLPSSLS